MKPILRTLAVLFAVSAALAIAAGPAGAADKPNIILILSDDFG